MDVEGHGKSGWDVADRDRALKLLQKYEYKADEATSKFIEELAAASDAGEEGVAPPTNPWNQPSDQSAYS